MNPLMDILRQQRALSGRKGFYEGGPSDRDGFGFGNFGQQGTSAPDSLGRPGGLNVSHAPEQNPHQNFNQTTTEHTPGQSPDDTDEAPEKNQWWSKFTKNLREDVTDFFSPENIQKGIMGLALSMVNPAGMLGLNGLLGMVANTGMLAAATSPSESELAQGQVDVAQANMDVAHDAGTEQAMQNAQAALSSAQAAEAAAAAAAAEANENEHGGNERPVYLASNPYQGVPYSGYQGSTMDPPPDYSHYVLSHDEKSMADGLEAIGYAPHTAIQYAMHYYNNAEAPVYT